MSELISRQAAIDAFDGHFAIVGRSSAERFKMYIEAVINDIRKLPPAQPEIPDDARDAFMNLVYDELHSDGDNNRANRIIDAADEYVEYSLAKQSAQLGTNLAEVGTDTISRQAAIDALKNDMASLDHIIKGMSGYDVRLDAYVSQRNQVDYDIDTISNLPPAQPEQHIGHWIPVGVAEVVGGESAQWGSAVAYNKCSECDEQALQDDFEQEVLSEFCPHCGAKMEGVSE